jgi:L-alanine-DL-glutamate epimerase and related enzymes of enolase superfamily
LIIKSVKTTMLRFRYDESIADAQSYYDTRNAVLVHVETDEGIDGLGESACFGGPPQITKYVIENELAPILIGEDATNISRIWRLMFDRTVKHGRGGIVMAAMSGIDIALWDIMGKKAKIPIYKLLGGYTDKLLPYASGGFYSQTKDEKALVEEVGRYYEQGFRFAKIKVGRNPDVLMSSLPNMPSPNECCCTLDEDLARVEACSKVAKEFKAELMVDANNNWNTFTAIKMGREFEKMGIYWLEEPLHPDNIEGSAELAAVLDIPIAGYESEVGLFHFREYINRHAVDIVQPDVIWSGGYTECMKIANYAWAHNLPTMPHVFSTAVCLAANMHFLAALGNGGMLELDRNEYPLRDELLENPIVIEKDGFIYMPQEPGLGIRLREDIVSKYTISD